MDSLRSGTSGQRESPYGTTVAHGFFTLSLSPVLAQQIYRSRG